MNFRLATSLTLSLISLASLYAADLRIVNCDEMVQSHKRGVCENHMTGADFQALAPGVSWYYNWHYTTNDFPPDGSNMTFIPMVWGTDPKAISGLESYLSRANNKPPVILAINEPNLKGQAFINPEKTADLFKQVLQVANNYNIPVVGPNMALGSGGGESISAFDPIQNKQITYTFMVPFLQAFAYYLGDVKPTGSAVHTYGEIGEMKWAVDAIHKATGTPIWVTEFACWKSSSDQEEIKYMMEATDFLERTDYVQGYAWFKERMDSNNAKLSLLAKAPGVLTPLGTAYVNMPVHDHDLFYRIPGNLNAGRYSNINGADFYPSKTCAPMVYGKGGKTSVDYNIYVQNPGTYTVNIHCFGKGTITLNEGTKVLGTATSDATDMHSMPATITLMTGCHVLTVNFQSDGLFLDSLEFVK